MRIGNQCTILCVASLSAVAANGAQHVELMRSSLDGGGVMRSTGGNLELSATIGQSDAGVMIGGNIELTGGFWFQVPPGDTNDDGFVSLADFSLLAQCLSGPGTDTVPPACNPLDLDRNSSLDLRDVGSFQLYFTGQ